MMMKYNQILAYFAALLMICSVYAQCNHRGLASNSTSATTSVNIQVNSGIGLPNQPTCFWGLDIIRDNSVLGLSTPSFSVVSDLNADLPQLVTRASSNLVASLFPIATNLSLSVRIPSYCNNDSVAASISFGVAGGPLRVITHVFEDLTFVATTLGSIWCSVGATCNLTISSVLLNSQSLNTNLTIDATQGVFGSLVQNLMFQSDLLGLCNGFELTATINLNCRNSGSSLDSLAKGLLSSNSKTQCRFSFGQLCL